MTSGSENRGRKRLTREERAAERKTVKQPWEEEMPWLFAYELDPYNNNGSYRRHLWEDHQRRLYDPRTCANCGKRNCLTSPYWTDQELIKACQECANGWDMGTMKLPEPKRNQYVVVVPGGLCSLGKKS
jgi:hypothetical protein